MISHLDLTVRGYELDSFGHVNNAVYLHYLEEGRWDFLRRAEVYDWMQSQGLFLAVVEVKIRYIHESRLNDPLRVLTMLRPGSLFVRFDQDIVHRTTKERRATAHVTTLLLDADRRPIDFPRHVRERWTEPDRETRNR